MNDAPFPTKEQIAEFVRGGTSHIGKREIARAFKLNVEQKRTLKTVLKEMKEDGTLTSDRSKKFTDPAAIPNVTVIEISGVDADGEVLARPVKWESEAPPPTIYVIADKKDKATSAPAVGERALARIRQIDDGFEARIVRRIPPAPTDILGVVIESEGQARILSLIHI